MSESVTPILPEGILDRIRELYAFPVKVELIERVATGYMSRNFVLQTGTRRLFLKEYRFEDRARVVGTHQAKAFFAERGIPIITPLIQTNGETIFEYQDRFYALFPFVIGRIVRSADRSLKAYRSSGEMLGKIHLAGRNGFERIAVRQQDAWNPAEFLEKSASIERLIQALPERNEFDRMTLEVLELKRRLAQTTPIKPETLTVKNDHLIHGDFHSANIFYNDQDEVTHVFDLEMSCIAPRSYELARSMDFICFSKAFDDKAFFTGQAFLQDYQSIYPISASELWAGLNMYYHKRIHSLWHETEHYLLGTTRVDSLYINELHMLRWYSEHLEFFIERLRSLAHLPAS